MICREKTITEYSGDMDTSCLADIKGFLRILRNNSTHVVDIEERFRVGGSVTDRGSPQTTAGRRAAESAGGSALPIKIGYNVAHNFNGMRVAVSIMIRDTR